MTHCNDQLIDQLLTQAEQEGRCLIPRARRSEKRSCGASATWSSPHAGIVRAQNTLG